MDTPAIVIISIIALIITLAILYHIIRSAVKSATQKQADELKAIKRMFAMMLHKQGFSGQDLLDVHDETPEKFWQRIRPNPVSP